MYLGKGNEKARCYLSFQKVHLFQRSVESVRQRLAEAERGGATLSAMGANAKAEADVQAFRNQLKVRYSCMPIIT